MNTKQHLIEVLKAVGSVLLLSLMAAIFYKGIVLPYWEARAQQQANAVMNAGPSMHLPPEPKAPDDNPSVLAKVADTVKTVIKETVTSGKGDRIYVFASSYNYIANPLGKTNADITQEIDGLVGTNECDSGGGYADCSLIKKTHAYQFEFMLHRQYAYYLVPASMGSISYSDPSRGFTVNTARATAWVEKQVRLVDSSGNEKEYLLYAFPSIDNKHLDGPLTGAISIVSP